ncbi:MAG TPA: hypothetical protein VGR03_12645 [Candidatus Acidoferrum sp.]|nr:hypothetical protein [Candidatus Acidoferrum sp.]
MGATIVGIFVLAMVTIIVLGFRIGWSAVLDWAVVAIPTIAGFAAWVIPVKETRTQHKWVLFVGGLAFSGLIYLQQYTTRRVHSAELANLPTKADIAKLPTAQDIVKEWRKVQTEEVRKEPGVPIKTAHKSSARQNQDTSLGLGLSKQLDDIKSMLAGQRWGLNAEQLVSLARRMTPYAPEKERGDLITCILGDPDSIKFATSLVAALRSAGWKLPGSGFGQAVFSGDVEGVVIKLNSTADKPPGLFDFVTSLREAGINPVGLVDPKVPPNEFQIIIGRKPG